LDTNAQNHPVADHHRDVAMTWSSRWWTPRWRGSRSASCVPSWGSPAWRRAQPHRDEPTARIALLRGPAEVLPATASAMRVDSRRVAFC